MHIKVSRKFIQFLPNWILEDQGSCFGQPADGDLFFHLAAIANEEDYRTSIDAHTSLARGESYKQPLRRTLCKIMSAYRITEPGTNLALSVRSKNFRIGSKCLTSLTPVIEELFQNNALGNCRKTPNTCRSLRRCRSTTWEDWTDHSNNKNWLRSKTCYTFCLQLWIENRRQKACIQGKDVGKPYHRLERIISSSRRWLW